MVVKNALMCDGNYAIITQSLFLVLNCHFQMITLVKENEVDTICQSDMYEMQSMAIAEKES